jgi:hypothetical protein
MAELGWRPDRNHAALQCHCLVLCSLGQYSKPIADYFDTEIIDGCLHAN